MSAASFDSQLAWCMATLSEKDIELVQSITDMADDVRSQGASSVPQKDPIEASESKSDPSGAATAAAEDENGEFEVEILVGHRRKEDHVEFLVKWKGYGDNDSTWEPIENVHPELVVEYFMSMLQTKTSSGSEPPSSGGASKDENHGLRAGLASMKRQLVQARSMCQKMDKRTRSLEQALRRADNENTSLKARLAGGRGNATSRQLVRQKKQLQLDVVGLKKELAAARSDLTTSMLHARRADEAMVAAGHRGHVQVERLVRKIERAIYRVASSNPSGGSTTPPGAVAGMRPGRKRLRAINVFPFETAANGRKRHRAARDAVIYSASVAIEDPAFL